MTSRPLLVVKKLFYFPANFRSRVMKRRSCNVQRVSVIKHFSAILLVVSSFLGFDFFFLLLAAFLDALQIHYQWCYRKVEMNLAVEFTTYKGMKKNLKKSGLTGNRNDIYTESLRSLETASWFQNEVAHISWSSPTHFLLWFPTKGSSILEVWLSYLSY